MPVPPWRAKPEVKLEAGSAGPKAKLEAGSAGYKAELEGSSKLEAGSAGDAKLEGSSKLEAGSAGDAKLEGSSKLEVTDCSLDSEEITEASTDVSAADSMFLGFLMCFVL